MRKCRKCGEQKDIEGFYKHPSMPDGRDTKCKECVKHEVRIRHNEKLKDPEWVEKERERHRQKYYRLGYKEKHKPTPDIKREQMKRWLDKYPEKKIATTRSAKIPRESEVVHHWSYNPEHHKDVLHLTVKEHSKAHRFIVYDQERMMYRTLDGELLDTKERHEKYIQKMIKTKPD